MPTDDRRLHATLRARGKTVAAAESLTVELFRDLRDSEHTDVIELDLPGGPAAVRRAR